MVPPTTRTPGVSLRLPADFHLLPLDVDVADRVAAQSRLLDELPMAAAGRRELVALYLEALSGQLRRADIAAAAFCAVRVGDHASTATLTVGLHPTGTTDRTLALLGAVATLRRTGGPAETGSSGPVGSVDTESLGGHPAARWSTERVLPGDAGDGLVLREHHVLVPAPGHPVAVLVTLATPTLQDSALYRDLLGSVCETVVFSAAADAEDEPLGRVLLLPAGVSTP